MTDNNNGLIMPVSPLYGGGGYGGGFGGWGSDIWLILIVLFALGGFGGWGGMGGFGGMMGMGMADGMFLYPWMNQAQITTNGFQNQALSGQLNGIQSGVQNLSTQLCNCCADMAQTVNSGFANAETAANARQIANMQQAYNGQISTLQGFNGVQSQIAQASADNRLGICNLGSDIAREACADRQAVNDGVRDILANQTAGIQRILDKLCDQELQAERRDNANLRSELMYARGQASQIEQTAQIRAGQNAAVNSLVNELRSCPIPAQPVYGSQPIFACPNNNGCGCNNF